MKFVEQHAEGLRTLIPALFPDGGSDTLDRTGLAHQVLVVLQEMRQEPRNSVARVLEQLVAETMGLRVGLKHHPQIPIKLSSLISDGLLQEVSETTLLKVRPVLDQLELGKGVVLPKVPGYLAWNKAIILVLRSPRLTRCSWVLSVLVYMYPYTVCLG